MTSRKEKMLKGERRLFAKGEALTSEEKRLRDVLFEIKFEAWESDRSASEYIRGYFWGRFQAVTEIEKALKIEIPVTTKEHQEQK